MALHQADKLSRIARFYRQVSVEPVAGGSALRLDGRAAKTAGGAPLATPNLALAELLAAEWEAQSEFIDFAAMPANRLAFTAIDRGPAARAGLADEVARYIGTDVLCYPAEGPRRLVERQDAAWTPWRTWATETLGLTLRVADGALHVTQPETTLAATRTRALALDDFALAGLAFATALYGSAVLAFAVRQGALEAVAAFELSRLEEAFQAEQWGLDAEAEARTEALRRDAAMIGAWFAALA